MSESVRESLQALQEAVDRLEESKDFAIPVAPQAHDADALRWTALDRIVDAQLAGRRVLVLGSRSSQDAFAFAERGADYVLACIGSDANSEDEARESEHGSIVEFRRSGWEALDPGRDGTFDIVHCHGLLHLVREPMGLLRVLRRMTADNGQLLISSLLLVDPERSEYLRFVPDRGAGQPGCWFVPGRLAFRWLVETAGFEVETEFGEREGPRHRFPVVTGYLGARCQPASAVGFGANVRP